MKGDLARKQREWRGELGGREGAVVVFVSVLLVSVSPLALSVSSQLPASVSFLSISFLHLPRPLRLYSSVFHVSSLFVFFFLPLPLFSSLSLCAVRPCPSEGWDRRRTWSV